MPTRTNPGGQPNARRTVPCIGVSAKQRQFLNDPTWLRGFVAGRGSGKSEVGAIDILLNARSGDPCMAVSPDSNVIEDTTWPTFQKVAEAMGVWIRGVRTPLHRAWFRTQDGGRAEIVFKSAEKPEKLRGPNKARLWFDEASVMCQDAYLYALPVLRWRGKMGPCTMTFTPKGRRHWTFETFFEQLTPAESDAYQDLLDRAGGDGATADHNFGHRVKSFGGTYYRQKPRTNLTTAHTLENPFLPREFYETLAGQYSTALAEQELAGNFVDLQGLMFRREWFHRADVAPRIARRCRYWDLAASFLTGCYTVGALLAVTDQGLIYVEDIVRGQWSAGERNKVILDTARDDSRRYNNEPIIYVEQEPGSGGKEQSQQMIRMLSGFPVYRDLPTGGAKIRKKDGEQLPGAAKIYRAQPLAAQAEAGNVYVVRGRWNNDFFDEFIAFPESKFCDQVDACSANFNRLANSSTMDADGLAMHAPEHSHAAGRFGAMHRQVERGRQRNRNVPDEGETRREF